MLHKMITAMNATSREPDFCIFSKTVIKKMCKSMKTVVIYLPAHIAPCRQTFTSPPFLDPLPFVAALQLLCLSLSSLPIQLFISLGSLSGHFTSVEWWRTARTCQGLSFADVLWDRSPPVAAVLEVIGMDEEGEEWEEEGEDGNCVPTLCSIPQEHSWHRCSLSSADLR